MFIHTQFLSLFVYFNLDIASIWLFSYTVFLPYLDYFITESQERFLSHSDIFKGTVIQHNNYKNRILLYKYCQKIINS